MIKITNVSVMNFENAIRGMRNPLNSWAKSDSYYNEDGEYIIGESDLGLAMRLANAGSDDRKFLRQIFVSIDIEAPLYWWKEMDQYKVGTVTNSCSTMHRIHSRNLELSDFSYEHLDAPGIMLLEANIDYLNFNRKRFVETRDKSYWLHMIQMLPTSYNQLRTFTANYEVLKNIYHARRHHKLDEWHSLCNEIEHMPYSQLIIGGRDERGE